MAEPRLAIDFFGEDQGHESFFRPLVRRLAAELELADPSIRTISARGGLGRAITELRGWLWARHQPRGDLLVVLIDANAVGWHTRRAEIEQVIPGDHYPATVIGCPDPHVEAWLLADPAALSTSLGVATGGVPPGDPLEPKRRLRAALDAAGVPILGDPMSVALDVVPGMDLYSAGQRNSSLGSFVDDLRAALIRMGRA